MGEGAAGTVANADTRINIHLVFFFFARKNKKMRPRDKMEFPLCICPTSILMRFFNFPHDLKMQIS